MVYLYSTIKVMHGPINIRQGPFHQGYYILDWRPYAIYLIFVTKYSTGSDIFSKQSSFHPTDISGAFPGAESFLRH